MLGLGLAACGPGVGAVDGGPNGDSSSAGPEDPTLDSGTSTASETPTSSTGGPATTATSVDTSGVETSSSESSTGSSSSTSSTGPDTDTDTDTDSGPDTDTDTGPDTEPLPDECIAWTMTLPSLVEVETVVAWAAGDVLVGGTDGEDAVLTALDGWGDPQWTFTLDPTDYGIPDTVESISDIAKLGQNEVVAIVNRGGSSPGIVMSFDIETQTPGWVHLLDAGFVPYPDSSRLDTLNSVSRPQRIATSAGGIVVVQATGTTIFQYPRMTMRLDPTTGIPMWLHSSFADLSDNLALYVDDGVQGVLAGRGYSAAGSQYTSWTRTLDVDTGEFVGSFGVTPLPVPPPMRLGGIAARSDGSIVTPYAEFPGPALYVPVWSSDQILLSLTTIAANPAGIVAVEVDAQDQVYMLEGSYLHPPFIARAAAADVVEVVLPSVPGDPDRVDLAIGHADAVAIVGVDAGQGYIEQRCFD